MLTREAKEFERLILKEVEAAKTEKEKKEVRDTWYERAKQAEKERGQRGSKPGSKPKPNGDNGSSTHTFVRSVNDDRATARIAAKITGVSPTTTARVTYVTDVNKAEQQIKALPAPDYEWLNHGMVLKALPVRNCGLKLKEGQTRE